MALEEVKLLQKQRERRSGIPAISNGSVQTVIGISSNNGNPSYTKNKKKPSVNTSSMNGEAGDADKDELVLQDTFAQETAVMVEDPNM